MPITEPWADSIPYEWRRPLALGAVVLMEFADYPMMRRMLRGIRERAEAGQAIAAGSG